MDSRLTYWSKQNERFEIYTDGVTHYGSITDRLAEYEDTGLTPEEIKRIINTNKNLVKQNDKQYLQLRDYRNTGLTPEEIRQLIKQKEELLEDIAMMETALDKYVEADCETCEKRACRVCGCTWNNACPGGCWWVEWDLCSKCADKEDLDDSL